MNMTAAHLSVKGVRETKKATLYRKKAFWAKKTQKKGFFGVFRYALEHFGTLLCHTKDTQTHKTTALMKAQGVETKGRHFSRK